MGLQPEIVDDLWVLIRSVRDSAVVQAILGGWSALDLADSLQHVVIHGGGALLLPLLAVDQLQNRRVSAEYSNCRRPKKDDGDGERGAGGWHDEERGTSTSVAISLSKSIGSLSKTLTSKVLARLEQTALPIMSSPRDCLRDSATPPVSLDVMSPP